MTTTDTFASRMVLWCGATRSDRGKAAYTVEQTVKVLKEGREQRGWAKSCRCTGENNGDGGCAAVLLVDEADLTAFKSTDMLGDVNYRSAGFKCPGCGVLTDLYVNRKPTGLPEAVWKRVWKRQNAEDK